MLFPHDYAAVLPLLVDRPLHLQHINVALGYQPDKAVWEQFLCRAGSRIRTAHVRELDRLPNSCLELDVVNEWIAMLLLHCTQLESLQLAMPHFLQGRCHSIGSNPFVSRPLKATLGSLARLHTLGLWDLHLDNEQVAAMVEACPLLEDCTLKTPLMSAGVLTVLGRWCPMVRRVWLEGESKQLLGEEAADSLLTSMQPRSVSGAGALCFGWFARLRVLYIDWIAGGYDVHRAGSFPAGRMEYGTPIFHARPPFPVSRRLIQLLPSLLAAAPLHYLHLPLLHDSSAQLLLLEPVARQLRGLSLLGRWSAVFEQCTRPHPEAARQWAEGVSVMGGEDKWWEKASDRAMTVEPRMKVWQRVFRAGGRAAFFAQLRKEAEQEVADFAAARRALPYWRDVSH